MWPCRRGVALLAFMFLLPLPPLPPPPSHTVSLREKKRGKGGGGGRGGGKERRQTSLLIPPSSLTALAGRMSGRGGGMVLFIVTVAVEKKERKAYPSLPTAHPLLTQPSPTPPPPHSSHPASSLPVIHLSFFSLPEVPLVALLRAACLIHPRMERRGGEAGGGRGKRRRGAGRQRRLRAAHLKSPLVSQRSRFSFFFPPPSFSFSDESRKLGCLSRTRKQDPQFTGLQSPSSVL